MRFKEWIYVPPRQFTTLEILEAPNVFDTASTDHRIRVVPFNRVSRAFAEKVNEEKPTIVILPTALYVGIDAWPYENVENVYIVPYSDHSSFPELKEFVSYLKPKKIIPVVRKMARGPFGINISDRADMSMLSQASESSWNKKIEIPLSVQAFMDNRSIWDSSQNCFGKKRKKPSNTRKPSFVKKVKRGVEYESPRANGLSPNDSFKAGHGLKSYLSKKKLFKAVIQSSKVQKTNKTQEIEKWVQENSQRLHVRCSDSSLESASQDTFDDGLEGIIKDNDIDHCMEESNKENSCLSDSDMSDSLLKNDHSYGMSPKHVIKANIRKENTKSPSTFNTRCKKLGQESEVVKSKTEGSPVLFATKAFMNKTFEGETEEVAVVDKSLEVSDEIVANSTSEYETAEEKDDCSVIVPVLLYGKKSIHPHASNKFHGHTSLDPVIIQDSVENTQESYRTADPPLDLNTGSICICEDSDCSESDLKEPSPNKSDKTVVSKKTLTLGKYKKNEKQCKTKDNKNRNSSFSSRNSKADTLNEKLNQYSSAVAKCTEDKTLQDKEKTSSKEIETKKGLQKTSKNTDSTIKESGNKNDRLNKSESRIYISDKGTFNIAIGKDVGIQNASEAENSTRKLSPTKIVKKTTPVKPSEGDNKFSKDVIVGETTQFEDSDVKRMETKTSVTEKVCKVLTKKFKTVSSSLSQKVDMDKAKGEQKKLIPASKSFPTPMIDECTENETDNSDESDDNECCRRCIHCDISAFKKVLSSRNHISYSLENTFVPDFVVIGKTNKS